MAASTTNQCLDILERGSNDNGTYIKFKDGTLICWKLISVKGTINNAFGSWYGGQFELGSWPTSFTGNPAVTVSSISSATNIGCALSPVSKITSKNCGQVSAYRPTYTNEVTMLFTVIGIGNWK